MKVKLDPETNARHSVIRIRTHWKLRPWYFKESNRNIIRDHIRIIRQVYPKHAPCEPVPYAVSLAHTMPTPIKLMDEIAAGLKDPNHKPWSVKQREAVQAWARRRTSYQNHLSDVWSGKLPQMRWNGTAWEEVQP